MTFSPVTGDNPFNPGTNFSVAIGVRDLFDSTGFLGVATSGFVAASVWPSGYSTLFGDLFDYAANGDVTLKTTGGSSSRPVSGLVYPRLV